jgi:hypothetical protein
MFLRQTSTIKNSIKKLSTDKDDAKMLRIGKMKLKDRPRMLQIVKDIWDGGDYMPLVFEDWVKDKKGEFAAAVDENGLIVGFEKLTMLTENDAWIEGLRKDLSMKVKGVGRFLTEHLLKKLSCDPAVRTVRFATYFHNIESISLFTKMGFRVFEKRNHKFYKLPKLSKVPEYRNNRAEILSCRDEILNYARSSDWVKINRNGICHSWVVKPYSDEMIIRDYIDRGRCVGIKENGRIRALCLYTIREQEDFFISLFCAETPELFKELLQKVKQLSYRGDHRCLCVVINKKDKTSYGLFTENRFKSWEAEEDFLIFDLPAAKLKDYK